MLAQRAQFWKRKLAHRRVSQAIVSTSSDASTWATCSCNSCDHSNTIHLPGKWSTFWIRVTSAGRTPPGIRRCMWSICCSGRPSSSPSAPRGRTSPESWSASESCCSGSKPCRRTPRRCSSASPRRLSSTRVPSGIPRSANRRRRIGSFFLSRALFSFFFNGLAFVTIARDRICNELDEIYEPLLFWYRSLFTVVNNSAIIIIIFSNRCDRWKILEKIVICMDDRCG